MRMIESPKDKNKVMIIAETDDDWRFLRIMWDTKAVHEAIGLYEFYTITILNEDLSPYKQLREKYPDMVAYALLSRGENLNRKVDGGK